MGEPRDPLLGRGFAVAFIGETIVVVALGWLTGLRHAMHGALLIGIATAVIERMAPRRSGTKSP
jgi:hypothetical protein